MRVLLDTHIALWAITDDHRLKANARTLIAAPANTVVVSAVTIWEVAIKHALGRGDMPISAAEALSYFTSSHTTRKSLGTATASCWCESSRPHNPASMRLPL